MQLGAEQCILVSDENARERLLKKLGGDIGESLLVVRKRSFAFPSLTLSFVLTGLILTIEQSKGEINSLPSKF